MSGSIDVNIGLSIGYDTNGLRMYLSDPRKLTSDLLDGFFIDNGIDPGTGYQRSGITVTGDIEVGAGAFGVLLEGKIHGTASLTIGAPGSVTAPGTNKFYITSSDFADPRSTFVITGDVTASLTVSVGVVFPDPIGEIDIFSYTLAETTLIDFTTLYNATVPPTVANPDANTIYINEQDGDQTIYVYPYSPPPSIHDIDGYMTTERDYYDVVDYGDTVQRYFLGTVTTYVADAGEDVPRLVEPVIDMPQTYNLIVALPKTANPLEPASGSQIHRVTKRSLSNTAGVGGITVDPAAYAVSFSPVNAVLFGGSGNDHLEYDAGGQATLVGGGGSNDLVGGTLEYGNFVTLEPSVNPTLGLPADVVNAITQNATGVDQHRLEDGCWDPLPDRG